MPHNYFYFKLIGPALYCKICIMFVGPLHINISDFRLNSLVDWEWMLISCRHSWRVVDLSITNFTSIQNNYHLQIFPTAREPWTQELETCAPELWGPDLSKLGVRVPKALGPWALVPQICRTQTQMILACVEGSKQRTTRWIGIQIICSRGTDRWNAHGHLSVIHRPIRQRAVDLLLTCLG